MEPAPVFFEDGSQLRAWLQEHHASATELWIGMWKVHTGRPSLTWAELVREALCFGWIDGQSRRIDELSHMQRLTPRRSRRWSAINVRLVEELTAAGLMTEAGLRAYADRDLDQVPYSLSDRPDQLPPEQDAVLRADPVAAAFWDSCPPSYRKSCAFWIAEAKRPQTTAARLAELVAACAGGERLARFRR